MLAHRWKRLGLRDPVSSDGNDHTPEQSHRKNQLATKADGLLQITSMKASQDAAQEENKDTCGLHCSSSNSSEIGLLEEKVNGSKHSSSNASGLSECHTASDLSDHEQESIQMSSWAAAVKLDLKPEPFDEGLEHRFTERAFYPEVLPASLMHSSQNLSSETQESLFVTDPCLVPVTARLMELERLQAATVEKERAKPGRSRPVTANTRNGNRPKKKDLSGSKTGISKDTECSSVMCHLTKLTVCSNCSCRHHICPSTKSGQGSKSRLPHPTLPKRPESLSGKCKRAETMLPTFSVSVKVPQKPTVPKSIKSPKTQKRSTSAKKATASNRKT